MSPPSVAMCKSAERPVVFIVVTTDKCSSHDSVSIHFIHYCVFLHQLMIPFQCAIFFLKCVQCEVYSETADDSPLALLALWFPL